MGGHTKCVVISKNLHHFLVGWNPVHYTLPETNQSPLRIKGLEDEMIPFGARPFFQGQSVKLLVSGSLNFIQGRKTWGSPADAALEISESVRPCRFPWRSDRAKKRRKDRSRKRHRDRERPRDLEKEAAWPVGSNFFGGSNLMLKCMVSV